MLALKEFSPHLAHMTSLLASEIIDSTSSISTTNHKPSIKTCISHVYHNESFSGFIYITVNMQLAQSTDAQNVAVAQVQTQAPRPFQIRACDECKRQKMKCSSHVDYPNPCERCQNRQQPCNFTDKPKRIIKRQ